MDELKHCFLHERPWQLFDGWYGHRKSDKTICWQAKIFSERFQRANGKTPSEITAWLKQMLNVERWIDMEPELQLWVANDMQKRGW
jgi:hypothetical protein|tara:strand:- start:178 stop:435 length:258 start_codon:yes stop_codon:yes gene_type:complete